MNKYVKKPIPVSAFKWDGKKQTIFDNMPKEDIKKYIGGIKLLDGTLILKTLEGTEQSKVGNMIIRGVDGEYYPCDGDIFKESYEPAK